MGNTNPLNARFAAQRGRGKVIVKPSYFNEAVAIPARMSGTEDLNFLLDRLVKD